MTKREDLYDQCRRLYVMCSLSRRAIALRMGVSERSLQTWATDNKDGKGTWDEQKAGIMDGESFLYDELMKTAAISVRQLREDLLNGTLDPKQISGVEKLVKSAIKAFEYHRKNPPTNSAATTKEERAAQLQGKIRERIGLR